MAKEEAIQNELNEVQIKIKELKPKFRDLKKSKEEYYHKGEEYSKEIEKLYNEIEKIEKEKSLDKVNHDLNYYLSEEERLKKQILELEDLLKKSKEKRPKIKTTQLIRIKKEIKFLENKLQVEVLSLSKESEIINKIKHLKDKLLELGALSDTEKVSKKDFLKYKRQLEAVQKKIKSIYKKIRLINKEKKRIYKIIDELKIKRKNAFDNFRKVKEDYTKVSIDLKELFTKEEELFEKLGKPLEKHSYLGKLSEKRKELEEKLKKGEVLTTEDLLSFQSALK